MPIHPKHEEVVPRVLKRLRKTKERAVGLQTDDSKREQLLLMFQTIEEDLHTMDGLLPQVKRIEKDMMRKFAVLEQEIDDDGIFDNHQQFEEITKKLQLVANNVQSIKDVISSVKLQLNGATDSVSIKQMQKQQQKQYLVDDERRRPSKEWSELIPEDRFLTSAAMQQLSVSFNNLTNEQSKMCSLFFSIFPENSVIKKRQIVYWWIAEGLVTSKDGQSAQEIGDDIFQDHINQRLIKPLYKNSSPITHCCTVHPWVHRLLVSLAKEAELFDFDSMGRPKDGHRRAFLVAGNQVRNGNGIREDTLISVFNVDNKYLNLTSDWLANLRKISALHLGRWQHSPKHHIEIKSEESLKGLKTQKHLKYLSLHGISRISALPRSITELISLEILDLRACHNLEKLPPDISSLRNLTHLDVSDCYLLENMPNGLEKLTKLQVLKGLVIGNIDRSSWKISDLAQLKNLRKLSIYIGTEAIVEEQEFRSLENITSLRNLTISWRVVTPTPDLAAAMKSLALPPGLEKLDLRCIPEETPPEWLHPQKLKAVQKLYIRGGQLKRLTSVDNKWNVKILRLKYLKSLTITEQELKAIFPEVVYVEKVECQDNTDIFYRRNKFW